MLARRRQLFIHSIVLLVEHHGKEMGEGSVSNPALGLRVGAFVGWMVGGFAESSDRYSLSFGAGWITLAYVGGVEVP
jgi:hypothetical protein